MTTKEEVQQLASYTRSELSRIPVFVPKQRYDVYSRHWSSSLQHNIEDKATAVDGNRKDDNDALPNSSKGQIKQLPNTWSCIILSTLFTILFYATFLAMIAVIVIIILRIGEKKADEVEMNLSNRTSPLDPPFDP